MTMPDLHEHAEALRAFAEGKKLEFRVKPGATNYGSTMEWYPCDNPDFHHSFEYRIRREEVEKLNIMAKIHEGDDG